MATIVPSILEDTIESFEDKLAVVLKIPEVSRVQIDIADGKFVDRKTIQIDELDVLNPAYAWEAHLMVAEPRRHFLDAKIAGFNCAIIHYEAVQDKRQLPTYAAEIRGMKMQAGLAVLPTTAIEELFPYLEIFDQILVFSGHLGKHSHEFHPETYARVQAIKKQKPDTVVEVDGGVNASNIGQLSAAGADLLVVGSGLFQGDAADSNVTQAELAANNYQRLSAEASQAAANRNAYAGI